MAAKINPSLAGKTAQQLVSTKLLDALPAVELPKAGQAPTRVTSGTSTYVAKESLHEGRLTGYEVSVQDGSTNWFLRVGTDGVIAFALAQQGSASRQAVAGVELLFR